jgi:hypothetical protein
MVTDVGAAAGGYNFIATVFGCGRLTTR